MDSESNILIIDDDSDICHLMERIISSEHYASKSIHHLQGMQEVVTDYKPQLIFLDNQLPDGTGVDQIAFLKHMFPRLKIVLLTADTKEGLEEQAEKNGADLFIRKPFAISAIKDALRKLIPGVSHAA